MAEITIKLYHECSQTCGMCSGSGEGPICESNCIYCKGHGVTYPPGFNHHNSEHEVEVEYDDEYPIEEQCFECPVCQGDMTEDVWATIKYNKSLEQLEKPFGPEDYYETGE